MILQQIYSVNNVPNYISFVEDITRHMLVSFPPDTVHLVLVFLVTHCYSSPCMFWNVS